MASSILKPVQREFQALEAVLNRDPNFRKWKQLQALIAEYERAPDISKPINASPTVSTPSISVPAPPISKPQSNAKQIVEAGVQFLRAINRRAKSKEIAEAVQRAGIEIRGGDKVGNVSAHMSGAKHLVDHRHGEGYGLREWSQPSVATPMQIEGLGDVDSKPH